MVDDQTPEDLVEEESRMDEPVPAPVDPGGARSKGYSTDPAPEAPVQDNDPVPLADGPDAHPAVRVPERDGGGPARLLSQRPADGLGLLTAGSTRFPGERRVGCGQEDHRPITMAPWLASSEAGNLPPRPPKKVRGRMRWLMSSLTVALAAVPLLGEDASEKPADAAPRWGTIKGRVVWDGGAVPKRVAPNLIRDQEACLAAARAAGKEILTDNLVVNPENRGVRWVIVWLVDPRDADAKLPLNPNLPAPAKTVTLDASCCFFEPHIVCLREGQTLVCKNGSTVPHGVRFDGPPGNTNSAQLLPPDKTLEVGGWKASPLPGVMSCAIHPWMRGYVRVFAHPYFAVTDENGRFEIKGAPAGTYRLVMWQEETGYFLGVRDRKGVPVAVLPDCTTDLGDFKFRPDRLPAGP
jgi:hypothetical protein